MSANDQISADQAARIKLFQMALADAVDQAIGLPVNLAVAVIAMTLTNMIAIGCTTDEQRTALVEFVVSNLPVRVAAAAAETVPPRPN